LDAKAYNESKSAGNLMPFDSKKLVITSMNYASKNAEEIHSSPGIWLLSTSAKIGILSVQRIRWAAHPFGD